jgi:dihydroflavonol-4-reductase
LKGLLKNGAIMRAFVTGGTGSIGGAVVRRLLEAGHEVKALARPKADTRQLDGLPVERVTGDLQDRESLRRGMTGCGWVFHVGALYSYWGYRWKDSRETNVEGTRQVMEVGRDEAIERIVCTSSISALGVRKDASPATEDTPATLADRIGPYQRSKSLAEAVAGPVLPWRWSGLDPPITACAGIDPLGKLLLFRRQSETMGGLTR